jgi:hypothetical protein
MDGVAEMHNVVVKPGATTGFDEYVVLDQAALADLVGPGEVGAERLAVSISRAGRTGAGRLAGPGVAIATVGRETLRVHDLRHTYRVVITEGRRGPQAAAEGDGPCIDHGDC